MKRRTLLKAAAVAVGAASWPPWLRAAFAEDCAPGKSARSLAATYRAAVKAQRPVLVFVIPRDPDEKWKRGRLFGGLLNHGGVEAMAALSTADVVAASSDDVALIAPSTKLSPEPLLVALATDGQARPQMVRAEELPAEKDAWRMPEFENRIEALSKGLLRILAPREERLSALTPEAWRAAESRINDPTGSLEGIEWIAFALARRDSARGDDLFGRLAALAKSRVTAKPMPGSRWAHASGCGVTLEDLTDDEQELVMCGMGHVHPKATRFLYFYAKNPRDLSDL